MSFEYQLHSATGAWNEHRDRLIADLEGLGAEDGEHEQLELSSDELEAERPHMTFSFGDDGVYIQDHVGRTSPLWPQVERLITGWRRHVDPDLILEPIESEPEDESELEDESEPEPNDDAV